MRVAYTFSLWGIRITILVNHPVLPNQTLDSLTIIGTQSILHDWLYKLTPEEKKDFQSMAYAIFAKAEKHDESVQTDVVIGNPEPQSVSQFINIESISAKVIGPDGSDIEMYITLQEYNMYKHLTQATKAQPQPQPQTHSTEVIIPEIKKEETPQTQAQPTTTPPQSADNKRKVK